MRTCIIALLALLSSLVLAGPALAAPATTVSLTFDDGRPSQMAAAQELVDRNMTATFYIITAQVGMPGVMTLSDVNTLKAQGMEIGAHTVLHPNLPALSSDEAKRQLCLSRNWLMDRGFDIYDMAYPYDSTNASVEAAVAACGYNSARSGGQLQCDSGHACSETTPPLDPYSLRTPNDFNQSTTLAQMKAMVTNAENHGGGWVPLELHDVCDGASDPLLPAGAQCPAPDVISRALYTQFLDWLEGEVDAGRVQVKTVHEVVGGMLRPEVAIDPIPVRTGNLLVNPSYETASTSGGISSCWANVGNGPDHPPAITTTSDAHAGAKALAISVPASYDSWAYNLIAPTPDLGDCAPEAIPLHHYTFSGWYKGDGQIRVVAYWRNADYQWARLDWGAPGTATFPSAAAWTKASFTFRAPAGATAVSAGFYVDGTAVNRTSGNSYTIDDTSLVDADAAAPASYALTLSTAGSGSGSVTSSPAGIACGGTCAASFTGGTSVTLTAAISAGSSFTGWSGDCSGAAATCTVAMSAAKSVTATFALLPVQLTAATAGTGSGSVSSSPSGIDCGATCQFSFANGASVTLTAAAAAGSSFSGWSGACSGASATCTLAMSAARSVTATFTLLPMPLSVATSGTGGGSVSSSPAGIACGAACQFSFVSGAGVTLTAVAAAGSSFTGWSGACSGASATCTVTMSVARSLTATFTLLPVQLAVANAGTGTGSVTSSPAGIACGAACQFSFVSGATVTLTAVAAAGSSFTGWGGACSGASPTCTVTMSVARSLTATFTLLPVQLAVANAGTGTGSVTSSPAGIACGATCQADFTHGATVTLTAVAAAGSSFTGWSGGCTGTSATCTVTMSAARSVTATFALLPVLDVATTGTGAGSVTSSPAGIACGATCEVSFASGTTVTLTAVASAGSTFTGWSGACSGTAATCTFVMSADRSATASFTVKTALTVNRSGTGSGAVTSSPAGIACGATCSASLANGTSVTLTAVASAGSTFTGWSGACSGTAATCTFVMSADRSATASFTVKAVLTVTRAGSGSGAVSGSAAGIACGATCSASLANGTSVTLTAMASAGSTFTGWSGACSGTAATCTFVMSADRTATAAFAPDAALAVEGSGSGTGQIAGDGPSGIDCGQTCDASIAYGATVTLAAVAAPGSTFLGWGGDCSGTSPTCTLVMTADRSVTASFTANPVLAVVKAGTGVGAVTSSLPGIACGAGCSEQQAAFEPGTSVTLTAVPADGSAFAGWSDASCGLATTCTVSLAAARTVTATFAANPAPPAVASEADVATHAPLPVIVTAPAAQVPVAVVPKAAVATLKRPAARVRPKLSGAGRAGRTLRATRGAWSGSPARFTFTWRRDGKVIGHGASHRVVAADRGRLIRCDVTAVNAEGSTTASSASLRVAR